MNIQKTLSFQPVHICEQHEQFGTASANIHEYLDPDAELVQAVQEFPAQKNVNKAKLSARNVLLSSQLHINLQNLHNSKYLKFLFMFKLSTSCCSCS